MTLQLPTKHAVLERVYPDEAAHQGELERQRQAAHIAKHGSLEGYRPPREFPCPGTLAVEDWNAVVWVIRCDCCAYETSAPNPDRHNKES